MERLCQAADGNAEQVLKYLGATRIGWRSATAGSNRSAPMVGSPSRTETTLMAVACSGWSCQPTSFAAFLPARVAAWFVRLGFGLLANCARERNLARCRAALGVAGGAADSPTLPPADCRRNGKTLPSPRRKAAALPALRASHAAAAGLAAASDRARVDRRHLSPTANGHVVICAGPAIPTRCDHRRESFPSSTTRADRLPRQHGGHSRAPCSPHPRTGARPAGLPDSYSAATAVICATRWKRLLRGACPIQSSSGEASALKQRP